MSALREWARGDWMPPRWYIRLSMAAAVVSAVLSLLVGCKPGNNFDSPPAGNVVDRKAVLVNGVMYRSLYVGPGREKVLVGKAAYDACPVGARWPTCKGQP
jgi:hypothetical protein